MLSIFFLILWELLGRKRICLGCIHCLCRSLMGSHEPVRFNEHVPRDKRGHVFPMIVCRGLFTFTDVR